jgi:hypothetical protein
MYRLEQIGPEQFALVRTPKYIPPTVRTVGKANIAKLSLMIFGAEMFVNPMSEHLLGHGPGFFIGVLASTLVAVPTKYSWDHRRLKRAIRRHRLQVAAGDVIPIPAAVYELYRREFDLAGMPGFREAITGDTGLVLELIEIHNDLQRVPSGGEEAQALRLKLEQHMQQAVREIAQRARTVQIAGLEAKYTD